MLRAFGVLVYLCLCLAGCSDPPAEIPTFRFTAVAKTDGEPLEGVKITADGRLLGATNAQGELPFSVRRPEGIAVKLTAECPRDYRAADEIAPVRLRAIAFASADMMQRGREVIIQCAPLKRTGVVVVRAAGGRGLPVLLQGSEIARTDDDGIAHLSLSLEPGSSFRLELDTSERPKLRPRSPTATFTIADADQIFVYDQPFEDDDRHRSRSSGRSRPTPAPFPRRPIPIQIN